jgi:hypothetical protein
MLCIRHAMGPGTHTAVGIFIGQEWRVQQVGTASAQFVLQAEVRAPTGRFTARMHDCIVKKGGRHGS